jgi:hypothetical protein
MSHEAPLPHVVAVALGAHDGRRAWTGDEIAIDFPSLEPIVARMREAFLGVDGDASGALSGDVTLSAAQARRGGSVLVEVPVWRVCGRCAGRGEVWDEACGQCAGLGHGVTRRRLDVVVPAGVREGMWMSFEVTAPQAPPTLVHLRVAIR